MKSQVFKGLNGKIYRLTSFLDITVDGDVIRLPQIPSSSSFIEVIGHIMMIVAAEPQYLSPQDRHWQLAHLQELRDLTLAENGHNPFYNFLDTLNRLPEPLSKARAIFVYDLIASHIRGLWTFGYRSDNFDNIFHDGKITYGLRFNIIDAERKTVFTNEHFKNAVYECRVPESESLTIRSYDERTTLDGGTTFHIVQSHFHGSENFYKEGTDVEISESSASKMLIPDFRIPGRFMLENHVDGLETSHGVSTGTYSVKIPGSWITGTVQRGPITTPARVFTVSDEEAAVGEITDLNAQPDFKKLLELYALTSSQSAAMARLEAHPRLGLTPKLNEYLADKTNFVALERDVTFIDQVDWSKEKTPVSKISIMVKFNPVLFNLLPEGARSLRWFHLRNKLTPIAFMSMGLSDHNMSLTEGEDFFNACRPVENYLKNIPDIAVQETIRSRLAPYDKFGSEAA
jgi:hypothetical protein